MILSNELMIYNNISHLYISQSLIIELTTLYNIVLGSMVPELQDVPMVHLHSRMGHKHSFIHISNRLHYLQRFI